MISKSMALIVGAVLFAAWAAGLGEPPRLDAQPQFSESLRVKDALPPGHPPIPGWNLPEGHPPVGQAHPGLPEGHPPIPWSMPDCPGMNGFDGGLQETGESSPAAPDVIST
jgi:hypothetical protein